MPTLIDSDGKKNLMSWKEIAARLWPFGKWCIVWDHILEGKRDGPKTSTKTKVVNAFYISNKTNGNSAMWVIGIKKIGGFFDGVEYKPTIPKTKQHILLSEIERKKERKDHG